MFEYLGVCVNEECFYCIEFVDVVFIWMYDFGMEIIDGSEVDLDEVCVCFEDVFVCIWSGELENDDFNCFVF